MTTVPRTVLSVRGTLRTGPDRLPELSLQLETGLTVVPASGQVLVFPEGNTATYWPASQRPVIEVTASERELVVRLFSRSGLRGLSAGERLLHRLFADAVFGWSDPADDDVPDDDETDDNDLDAPEPLDPEIAEELGIDGDRWAALVERPWAPELLADVLAALGLPAGAGRVLAGEWAPGDIEGAVHVPHARLVDALRAGIIEPPSGDSAWARWRRIPFERPGLSWLMVVGEAVLAAGAALGARRASDGWARVLRITAVALAVETATDAALLVAVRRRQRG